MDIIRMNGVGNSFFVLEDPEGELRRRGPGALARQLCRPEEGEQTDGMIVIIPAKGDEDFGMLFYNADGSLGEMCGNGARCAARYAFEHGLVRDDQQIRFLATAGEIRGRRITEDMYEVRLNNPSVVDRHRLAVTPDEAVRVRRELARVVKAFEAGAFEIREADQDVHMAVERRLTATLGDLGHSAVLSPDASSPVKAVSSPASGEPPCAAAQTDGGKEAAGSCRRCGLLPSLRIHVPEH